MIVLLLLSIGCFASVFWVAVDLARQAKAGRRRDRIIDQRVSTHRPVAEFFEAGECRTPRSLRLMQNIKQHVAQDALPRGDVREIDGQTPALATNPAVTPFYSQHKPGLSLAAHAVAEHPALKLETDFLRESAEPAMPISQGAGVAGAKPVRAERRKVPRTGLGNGTGSVQQRRDWALYNKDMGDLTDPYTQPQRAVNLGNGRTPNRY